MLNFRAIGPLVMEILHFKDLGDTSVISECSLGANIVISSPPEGVARYCFHLVCLCVCLCVCVCVCVYVCPANILIFYFSATRRDIDLKCIQDTYRVVLDSLKKIDLHRSTVKVTGTVRCFLKVQSYHKN